MTATHAEGCMLINFYHSSVFAFSLTDSPPEGDGLKTSLVCADHSFHSIWHQVYFHFHLKSEEPEHHTSHYHCLIKNPAHFPALRYIIMLLLLTDFHKCVLSTVIYWLHQHAVHYCCRDMQKSAAMPLKNQCRHYVSKKMCGILLTHIHKHVWLYYLPCNTLRFLC